MATDLIDQFLLAPTEERINIIRDENNKAQMVNWLGMDVYEEYARLAGSPGADHLSIKSKKNLIVIPGVMGSLLQSESKGGIWWIDVRTRKHIDDLRLSPDGTEDADPDNAIVPCSVDTAYEPFLTAILKREDFGHRIFAYDWRKPLSLSSAALRDLIVQTFDSNGNNPVHIAAHSMGGLMLRVTLMNHGEELWPKIGRMVFMGTPHYGSPAIAGYLKNHFWGFNLMALLGTYLSRETFRTLWGVLGMLPAPRGIYPGTRDKAEDASLSQKPGGDISYDHPCVNFDMYDASAWKLELTAEDTSSLQKVLDGAATFHKQLYDYHKGLDQIHKDKMLVIAGVGYKTLFKLTYQSRLFGMWKSMDKIISRIAGDLNREGDGRVPLASASLEHVKTCYVKGVHAELTNIPVVYEAVFKWLSGDDVVGLPDSWQGAINSHLAADEAESAAPRLDGSIRKQPFSDDPGLWEEEASSNADLSGLDRQLDEGKLSEFLHIRLL